MRAHAPRSLKDLLRSSSNSFEPVKLELPWPPSVNHYWRRVSTPAGVRTLVSKEGREYQKHASQIVLVNRAAKRMDGRLAVSIELYPPDRCKRDIDNSLKSVLDALTHAKVWLDDEQIDLLVVERKTPEKPGRLVVTVEEINRLSLP